MKSKIVFVGIGVLFSALLTFLLKLSKGVFLNKPLNLAVIFGVMGLTLLVIGWVKKRESGKFMKFFGLGIMIDALLVFLLSLIKLTNNVTLLILFLVIGLGTLFYGAIKGK